MLRYLRVLSRIVVNEISNCRSFADACSGAANKKGLVLGAYEGCNPGEYKLTPTAAIFDEAMGGSIAQLIKGVGLAKGEARVYTNISGEYAFVGVAGLGEEGIGYSLLENLDQSKENIRVAAGAAAIALQDQGVGLIFVEPFTNAEAAAEGASLGIWRYQEFKNKDKQEVNCRLDLFESGLRDEWTRGLIKADAQNVARRFEETPSNMMTPGSFAQATIETVCGCGVQVDVKDSDWMKIGKMEGYLNTSKGSCEQPLFIKMNYCGGNLEDKPIVLIGKGVTHDTGGLCLKKCEGMSEYRADLAGGAVVVAVMKAAATMALPVNLMGLVPLCENMPGGMSMKPGDIVHAPNGKTIQIEDTDNEGRLLLADALCFAKTLDPCLTISVATLAKGMRRAFGGGPSGAFTTSDVVWRQLSKAGAYTGDRVWRLPFWKYFTRNVTDYTGVDVSNVGKGKGGQSCLAAAFLMEFAPPSDFLHLDITGTGMRSTGIGYPYLRKGVMTGRPTRTIIEFIYQTCCPHESAEDF